MIVKENQIFNLMDTNGRRNDVTNALKGYLLILDNLMTYKCDTWDNIPKSLSQYYFYKEAISMFPDVFKVHTPYDNLVVSINKMPKFKEALENNNIDWIRDNYVDYSELISRFDNGIEDRARHYTSNLVKLGFTDEKRNITSVGRLIIDIKSVKKDKLEKIIPIDEINLVYLRQLLKLRIFNKTKDKYYAPFCLALYMLLKYDRISESDFFGIVQSLSPYDDLSNIDERIEKFESIVSDEISDGRIPEIINRSSMLSRDEFNCIFTNAKSSETVNIYWEFYCALFDFYNINSNVNLSNLLSICNQNSSVLNKAFGGGAKIFYTKKNASNETKEFLEKNNKIFECDNINLKIYQMFMVSKYIDGINEYSDTTKRIFKATGLISFDNGYVELAYKELMNSILDNEKLSCMIGGNMNDEQLSYEEYEVDKDGYFCTSHSLIDIFNYDDNTVQLILDRIKQTFNDTSIDNIANIVSSKRKKEFEEFIINEYPVDKVKEILLMFNDRANDERIKSLVSMDASIPTIYEYIVGIAWFYFSDKTINLLESYNLSLSANFEPLVHAGGGQGDIVIYSNDNVIMLEVTLMNANSQKRGEWEPVLRHSINLKIDEENNGKGRTVTSFFIADEFDNNTINIWKAIAYVPLESSLQRNKYTSNVVIMPINNIELSKLIDRSDKYNDLISKVHMLFEIDNRVYKSDFNMNWRSDFIEELLT